jgi:prepilin-type N-terminal cleavage/methylation domain-containing protein
VSVRLRDERGFTLVELLIAMVVSLIVLGGTLTVLVALSNGAQRTVEHNDAQDTARVFMDRLARQLRNLASPSIFTEDYQAQPYAVDAAAPYDIVFRVVDEKWPAGSLNQANVKRVRYCLDATDPERGKLYQQEQTWSNRPSNDPPLLPALSACPGLGWATTTLVTGAVVNRAGGQTRPLFVYNSADLQRISQIHVDLFIDPTPGRDPVETRLGSGVTLRNQNRVPVAELDIAYAPGKLVLNGSASEDPEGMALTYQWYLDPPTPLPDCTLTPRPTSCLAAGVVIDAPMPPPGSHRIVLAVKDPAGLPDVAEDTRTYTP